MFHTCHQISFLIFYVSPICKVDIIFKHAQFLLPFDRLSHHQQNKKGQKSMIVHVAKILKI